MDFINVKMSKYYFALIFYANSFVLHMRYGPNTNLTKLSLLFNTNIRWMNLKRWLVQRFVFLMNFLIATYLCIFRRVSIVNNVEQIVEVLGCKQITIIINSLSTVTIIPLLSTFTLIAPISLNTAHFVLSLTSVFSMGQVYLRIIVLLS